MLGGVCAGEGRGGAQSGWCTAAPHGSNEAVKGSLHGTHSSSMIPTNTWFGQGGQWSQWDGGVCVCVRVPRAHPTLKRVGIETVGKSADSAERDSTTMLRQRG